MKWTKEERGCYWSVDDGNWLIEPYYTRDNAGRYYHDGYAICSSRSMRTSNTC